MDSDSHFFQGLSLRRVQSVDKNKGEASTSLWSKCQSLFQPLTFYFPAHSAFALGEQWWIFNRAALGRSANLCNDDDDDDDIGGGD